MSQSYLIHNATLINEGKQFTGSVLIEGEFIKKIYASSVPESVLSSSKVIDGSGKWLVPGVIDDQVHFREPGLTHKGEILTEARSAVAGGTTSYMEMPNTKPQSTTLEALEAKYDRAAEVSLANYSFYLGATNENLDELKKLDSSKICGVKVFMGSSTGNMLVDAEETLKGIFSEVQALITTHCEDEGTIRTNIAKYKEKFGDDVPLEYHPIIRDDEACYKSSSFAVEMAKKYGARLHILHISSEKELALFDNTPYTKDKRITAEVCVHHLLFSDEDYATKKAFIKWNPSVKKASDRDALMQGLLDDRLDVVATDHAPHLEEEKVGGALKAMSGGPMVQHSLVSMLEFAKQGKLSLEKVIEKMCHLPAQLYAVEKRGYIREGYFADLVLVDPEKSFTVAKDNILYKCGWSPLEGMTFSSSVEKTFVSGHLAFDSGTFDESIKGKRLSFIPFSERFK